jgi:hypothetical protein
MLLDRVMSSGLSLSQSESKGHMAFAKKAEDGEVVIRLILDYATSQSIMDLSTKNTCEIRPVFAKSRHHRHGRILLPLYTLKTNRQLPHQHMVPVSLSPRPDRLSST